MPLPATLPTTEHEALASIVHRYGMSDVLLDLAATAEGIAAGSGDMRTVERRGEVAKRLLGAALAADRLRL